MTCAAIQKQLERLANPTNAIFLQRFFKTGPGEYGAGDQFRGIRVPVLRKVAREHAAVSITETERLLKSPFHEDRLLALLMFVRQYAKGDEKTRERIYTLYLKQTRYINNWDLIDSSAMHIVGAHLADKDRAPLQRLAISKSLWERRIAIMATFHFIRQGEFEETLKVAEVLLTDEYDLIHKAVGWLLREVGNRDMVAEETFLREHCRTMPRTMLRYAIEKFPEAKRLKYLRGQV